MYIIRTEAYIKFFYPTQSPVATVLNYYSKFVAVVRIISYKFYFIKGALGFAKAYSDHWKKSKINFIQAAHSALE